MEITFFHDRGLNLRDRPTLYRVAIKAGLYRKAVQVCYIPIPGDILPLQIEIHPWISRSPRITWRSFMHICGLFTVGAKCNRWKNGNNIFPRPGIEPGPLDSKSYTLPRRYKSRLYSDVVECWALNPADSVWSPVGENVIWIFSPFLLHLVASVGVAALEPDGRSKCWVVTRNECIQMSRYRKEGCSS